MHQWVWHSLWFWHTSLLTGPFCDFSAGNIARAQFLYDQLIKLGFRPEDSAAASLITRYGQIQQLEQAQEVFKSASNSLAIGATLCNAMVDAFCKCGKVDEANQLHRESVSLGNMQDAVTISILVNALAKHGMHLLYLGCLLGSSMLFFFSLVACESRIATYCREDLKLFGIWGVGKKTKKLNKKIN